MKRIRLALLIAVCMFVIFSEPSRAFSQTENDFTDHTPTKEELIKALSQPRPRSYGGTCTFHKSRSFSPSAADKSVSLEVNFASNGSEPLADSLEALRNLGEVISTAKHLCFEIVGHTDSIGKCLG